MLRFRKKILWASIVLIFVLRQNPLESKFAQRDCRRKSLSLELLKLLTPKSVSLERSSRGRDALSWEDIAAALATTRPLASLYARLCYTRDTSKIEILEQKLLVAVVEADELQSTVIKISALRDLIKLSLIEAYHGQQFPVREKNSDVFSSKKYA